MRYVNVQVATFHADLLLSLLCFAGLFFWKLLRVGLQQLVSWCFTALSVQIGYIMS